jgi:hypothetical protein
MNLYILQLQFVELQNRCNPSKRENRQMATKKAAKKAPAKKGRQEGRKEGRKEEVADQPTKGNIRGGRSKRPPQCLCGRNRTCKYAKEREAIMTRRRWIAEHWDEATATIAGAQAEHMARVLRAQPGMEADVVAGGHVFHAEVAAVTPG